MFIVKLTTLIHMFEFSSAMFFCLFTLLFLCCFFFFSLYPDVIFRDIM